MNRPRWRANRAVMRRIRRCGRVAYRGRGFLPSRAAVRNSHICQACGSFDRYAGRGAPVSFNGYLGVRNEHTEGSRSSRCRRSRAHRNGVRQYVRARTERSQRAGSTSHRLLDAGEASGRVTERSSPRPSRSRLFAPRRRHADAVRSPDPGGESGHADAERAPAQQ